MRVHVDAAGHHIPIGGVDLDVGLDRHPHADRRDPLVLDHTSAFVVSVAVTTVPPLMRVFMRSSSFPDVRAFRHHPTGVGDRQTRGRERRAILHR